MDSENWLKQSRDKPLFENILWLKPENPHQRPKVVIIGGTSHGFAFTTKLYDAIKSKTAYQTRVIFPSSLEKILGHSVDDAVFVAATATGEIAQEAKNEIISAIEWADAIIFSSDLGNNSQTEILVASLINFVAKPTYFMADAIVLLEKLATSAVNNPHIILVGELAQIAKFNTALKSPVAILQSDGLVKLVDKFQELSKNWQAAFVTYAESQIIVAEKGNVCTTNTISGEWITKYAAGSVQFAKIFSANRYESLCTSAYLIST